MVGEQWGGGEIVSEGGDVEVWEERTKGNEVRVLEEKGLTDGLEMEEGIEEGTGEGMEEGKLGCKMGDKWAA